jgi:DNA-binding transcriptional ArsR family regulator
MGTSREVSMQEIIEKCDEVSAVLKSLSHPVRLKVLCRVLDGESSVNELTEFCGIAQSAMSQFLIRMRGEGLLESRKEGTHVFYRIADSRTKKLLRSIKEIYCK